MRKKYEFTGETKKTGMPFDLTTLHRIRAIADFGNVRAGDLGGWIEKEENLDHLGKAWVYGNAEVSNNARVFGDAQIYEDAKVYDNAEVWGCARVHGRAYVGGYAEIFDCANVYENAQVDEYANVYGDSKIHGNSMIRGNAEIYGKANVFNDAEILESAHVFGDSVIFGYAKVRGNANVSDNAKVFSPDQVLVIGAIGSRDDFITFYRDKDNEITVRHGNITGKIDKFSRMVEREQGNCKHGQTYRAAAELAKLQIDLTTEAPETKKRWEVK
jgi:carbonic anhydrase/acetyltransferase-like protein (isoleucine patch superfamily)